MSWSSAALPATFSAASSESVNEARANARVAASAAEARSERSISRSIGEYGDGVCGWKSGSGRSAGGVDGDALRAASGVDCCRGTEGLMTCSGNNRPQVQFEQNSFAGEFRRQHRSPCFRHRATNRWEISCLCKFSMELPCWQQRFTPSAEEYSVASMRLAPSGGGAKLPACQERADFSTLARERKAAEGAGARNAPNAQAKGLTRRPSNTGVPHWRETMRPPVRRRRDRPPKGQAAPAHRRCNLSGKADSEGIHPPYKQGRNCLPSKDLLHVR